MSSESFKLWAAELNTQQLHPGEVVEYVGPIERCEGLWVVSSQTLDTSYKLRSLEHEWMFLQAPRSHLLPLIEGE